MHDQVTGPSDWWLAATLRPRCYDGYLNHVILPTRGGSFTVKTTYSFVEATQRNLAASAGHWTRDSRGANIRCSPVGHAPHVYSYAVTKGWCYIQPQYESINRPVEPLGRQQLMIAKFLGKGLLFAESKTNFGVCHPNPVVCDSPGAIGALLH
jgi:hypothetical protein